MSKLLIVVLSLFGVNTQSSDTILFIGDSMTSYQYGWHHQFAKKLGRPYHNRSVPGKRTDWMKYQLVKALKNNKYKTCVIWGGINDGFSYVKLQSAIDNLQYMINLCNIKGVEPVVIVGYDPSVVMNPLHSVIKKPDFHRNRYIEIQKMMVSQLKNCQLIPIATTITRADSDDGIHFRSSGHKKFAEWVYQNYPK